MRRIIPAHRGNLLNVTVRDVEEDRDSFLRYAERLNFVPIEITGAPRIEVHLSNGTRGMVPCHDQDVIAAVFACLRSDAQEARPC
jgi:hypothetical protein